ncbi:MAG: T9SS type A sorting domain-containing protein [Bacteroidia bacterium]
MKKFIYLLPFLFLTLCANAQKLDQALTFGSKAGGAAIRKIATDKQGCLYSTGTVGDSVDLNPGSGVSFFATGHSGNLFLQKLDANGNYLWAKIWGLTKAGMSWSIALSDSGHVYITGYFQDSLDADPGTGIYNLYSAGGLDAFLIKLDTSGNFIWAHRFGGVEFDNGQFVGLDKTGNVYLTGNFRVSMDFNPGAGIDNKTAAGINDFFIIKLSSAGQYIWGKKIGGSGVDIVGGSLIDGANNLFITGEFAGNVDFNPNSGVNNLSSAGSADFYVLKLDSGGNYLWAKSMGGSNTDKGNSLDIDAAGNLYCSAYFRGTSDFNPGAAVYNLTSAGTEDAVVVKLTPAGNFVWAIRVGGSQADYITSIKCGVDNNLYCSGYFRDTVDFNPGPDSLKLIGPVTNAFFLQLDSAGIFIRAFSLGSNNYPDYAYDIIPLQNGAFYLAGEYRDTCDFDPKAGVVLRPTVGPYKSDAFVAKYSTCSNTMSSFSATVCNRYTAPDGKIYYTSGNYTATLPNQGGCDSIISMQITISSVDSGVTQNGQTLTANNTGAQYQWINCNSFSPITNASGRSFTSGYTGNYAVIVSKNGCIDTSDCFPITCLATNSTIDPVVCKYYTAPNGVQYFTTGTYSITIPNYFGCDSNITMNITIKSVDVVVTLNGKTLTSSANNAQYQWLNCDLGYAPVSGANGKQFTPAVSGDYAVAVTQNGCSDTTACLSVLISGVNAQNNPALNLYPNPAQQTVTINLPVAQGVVSVFNSRGQLVLKELVSKSQQELNIMNLPNGLYLLKVAYSGGVLTGRFCKN